MRIKPNHDSGITTTYHDSETDDIASITKGASAEEVWVLDWVAWIFDKAPGAAETLTVTIAGSTVLEVSVTAIGPGFMRFGDGIHGGIYGEKNQALVVALSASTATTVGKVSAGIR